MREGRHQLVGLVVKIVMEITPKQAIDQRGLSVVVVTKGRSALRCEEHPVKLTRQKSAKFQLI
jgi:hypothetical protein